MKNLLDLLVSANQFALDTIDESPSAALNLRAAQAFEDAKGASPDWILWNETANNSRAQYRLRRDDKLPSQLVKPATP